MTNRVLFRWIQVEHQGNKRLKILDTSKIGDRGNMETVAQ